MLLVAYTYICCTIMLLARFVTVHTLCFQDAVLLCKSRSEPEVHVATTVGTYMLR